MSEFRQATSHVEALEARLALLQQSIADSTANGALEESFSFILAAIDGDVDTIMEKFRLRCSMVDPVTNQPRFGPKMLAKVQDLLRRYDNVKLTVEEDAPLRLQVQSKLTQLTQQHATRQQEEAAREKEANEAQRAAELAKEQEKERLLHEAQEREAERQQEEQKRIQALAVAAHKKREQREKERAEEERQQQLEEQERERLNASIPHGIEGLEMAIAMLREGTGSETLFRQSLQKLLAVVSNICKSPENAAFRHIPKDNTHFHADLGQYPGGHQCLFAMGFKELQQGDETQPRTVFVLEEPDLSEDLDAWSTWFEELKELQNLVESKL
ncbi:hypothetical protein JG687_00008874 [Phytophthora cactorum]|uniref:PUB domain-containing protein n=1 Tax=Phytophthora cactorum TaxID=29920 RepID=A0A8T1UB68_9STRA|nr:hypothetical protein PC120_g14639 [Phytophthora cactorum]KAG3054313.1 hypothetical protein PC121_g16361 [Phytophthora cactorum]KAG3190425.1 hypothetical protein PC128_g11313 [Phytophthora cactorum]KAG4050048.1 hypothetical protein PC123_g14699 [Phytophthora cactorum]KAG6959299.1 hypothetical protein JG687_00008874 [Phytophthora cactorum]